MICYYDSRYPLSLATHFLSLSVYLQSLKIHNILSEYMPCRPFCLFSYSRTDSLFLFLTPSYSFSLLLIITMFNHFLYLHIQAYSLSQSIFPHLSLGCANLHMLFHTKNDRYKLETNMDTLAHKWYFYKFQQIEGNKKGREEKIFGLSAREKASLAVSRFVSWEKSKRKNS